MLYHLIYPLHEYISGFNLFRYITIRSAAAIVVSLLVVLFCGVPFINFMKKEHKMVLRKLTPRGHKKKFGIPSMGGVLIVAAIVLGVLVSADLTNLNILFCLFSLVGFALIGFFDDYIKFIKKDGKGIASRLKLTMQIILALLVAVGLYYRGVSTEYMLLTALEKKVNITHIVFPFVSKYSLSLSWLYIPFASFVIVSFSNAVNITDGLDGLAVGLILLVVFSIMLFAYVSGHFFIADYLKIPFIMDSGELAVFGGAIVGACLGFLWFNAYPAQIFMGDTGSLALGGMIGVLSLILKIEIVILFIGGVFVIEAASVVLQVLSYKLTKKRIFKMAPLHHHFEMIGWHESKIVLRFWIVGIILALIGVAFLKVR